jgi:hypothetical protein
MAEVIFLKGKKDIIELSENIDKSETFYSFIENYFEDRGMSIDFIDSAPSYRIENLINDKTKYVLGHSRGANEFLRQNRNKKRDV